MSKLRFLVAALFAAGLFGFANPANAAPARDVDYTVAGGDTLSAIGARCGVGWQKIAVFNNIANPSRISVGQKLTVPGASSLPAAPGGPGGPAGRQPDPQQAAAAPAAPAAGAAPAGFGYGIQVHAPGGDQTSIDKVAGMRFNWVKQQVEWFRHEGSKGVYDFGGLDNLVNQANAAGINVMLSVVKAPHWARPGNTDFSVEGPPANPQDMADFMGAMAAHFRGRVKAYEIWNEQNLHYEWGNEPLSAARYTQLLCSVYGSVKANDAGAIVISGALTPTGVNDGRLAIDDVNYLRQMMANGAGRCANGIGAHPSGYNNPATVRAGCPKTPKPHMTFEEAIQFKRNKMSVDRTNSVKFMVVSKAKEFEVFKNLPKYSHVPMAVIHPSPKKKARVPLPPPAILDISACQAKLGLRKYQPKVIPDHLMRAPQDSFSGTTNTKRASSASGTSITRGGPMRNQKNAKS